VRLPALRVLDVFSTGANDAPGPVDVFLAVAEAGMPALERIVVHLVGNAPVATAHIEDVIASESLPALKQIVFKLPPAEFRTGDLYQLGDMDVDSMTQVCAMHGVALVLDMLS
jgi:hypothetical protein